jgi:hypothetical protein
MGRHDQEALPNGTTGTRFAQSSQECFRGQPGCLRAACRRRTSIPTSGSRAIFHRVPAGRSITISRPKPIENVSAGCEHSSDEIMAELMKTVDSGAEERVRTRGVDWKHF